jgi:hypothetical protein
MLRAAGRDVSRFQSSPFVDPRSDLSAASLAAYRSRREATRDVLANRPPTSLTVPQWKWNGSRA